MYIFSNHGNGVESWWPRPRAVVTVRSIGFDLNGDWVGILYERIQGTVQDAPLYQSEAAGQLITHATELYKPLFLRSLE